MVGTACDDFRRHFGWKVLIIRLLYRIVKEKLKIQGYHPFNFGFGFTSTCIMIVYDIVMKSSTNQSRNGDQNNYFFLFFFSLFLNVHYHAELTDRLSSAG